MTETILCPREYSLGKIQVIDPEKDDDLPSIDATGEVQVQEGATLLLQLSQAVCDDLRLLETIPSRLLQGGISIMERSLAAADLSLLSIVPGLTNVEIRNCDLTGTEMAQLACLQSLRHLCLGGSTWASDNWTWLPRLTKIESLGLQGTTFDDRALPFLKDQPMLKRLDLSSTNISALRVSFLWELQSLEELSLGMCDVTDQSFQSCFVVLPVLRSLNLSLTSVGDEGMMWVSEHSRLDNLSLMMCRRITDSAVRYLERLPELEVLNLIGCGITDQAVSSLSRLSKLRFLGIMGTGISKQGREILQESLPQCILA